MIYLSGIEEKVVLEYILKTAEIAKNATCKRRKCGSIIVMGDEIIGSGFNSPPNNDESQRRCGNAKDLYDQKVTDKTCCVHAEQRAIVDALVRNSKKIAGSRLYFASIDVDGNLERAGNPYCTLCSKLSLDVSIAEFILWRDEGISVYNTAEYNKISFEFKG